MFNDKDESEVRLEATDGLSDTSDVQAGQPSEKHPTPPQRAALGVGRRAGSRSKGGSATRKPGKTLGQVIRKGRQELHLTQRELAEKVGVKPAHIAYLELDRRRPSLPLLARIAEILGLDREMLIGLSHPEAKAFMGMHKTPAPAKSKDQVWKQFTGNQGLLTRHQVTGNELKVLRQVNLLGKISAPRNFMFILNSIRQAQDEEDSE
jgi:transcriptional regulator with XRE-family HTH domain